ncbi:Phosphoesterase [Candidatus Nitrosotalea sp. TS]|uniref:hypothetical protein n=1 Tax=Candidatus Nitrosotalea sp. TS TaxID=2341020 RepID=UPI001EC811D5|nr:hypothetical protein [Candidatus Nitrosotalea sp. TS]NHI02527.1 Phosphoesterase [Candidatus Nitrosotalea sp. TS]
MVLTRLVQSQPALILEDKKRYLVVTDLHIGFESKIIANDIHIGPKEIIAETIQSLEKIIESEKPDSLVLLGDVKSSVESISKIEWDIVPLFFEIGKKIETICRSRKSRRQHTETCSRLGNSIEPVRNCDRGYTADTWPCDAI